MNVLADRVAPDDPIRYADAIVVAPDGTIYFTDASTRFSPAAMGRHVRGERARHHGAIRHRPRARLRPGDGKDSHRGMGLSPSPTGSPLGRRAYPVRERDGPLPASGRSTAGRTTSTCRLARPQARVLLDNLPGYPDNLMRGHDGRIWVGLFKPRNPAADSLAQRPFLRKVLLRLPRSCCRWASPMGTSSPLTRRPGHRRSAGPDRRPRDDRRDRGRPIASISIACTRTQSAGCRDDERGQRSSAARLDLIVEGRQPDRRIRRADRSAIVAHDGFDPHEGMDPRRRLVAAHQRAG